MEPPDTITALVSRFRDHYDVYKDSYSEAQVRADFVDPFLQALGWDVTNTQGHAEAYREVLVEDPLRARSTVTAPDYAMRIGGIRKFFVEAKRPSVFVRDNVPAAYQLRRYGWSAKLPLSIVTDFEEFAVYDCSVEPKPGDAASVARVLYMQYTDYLDRWDEIADRFSREAVWQGRFDKFSESSTRRRGVVTVDASLLATIRRWRADLAKNVARLNPAYSVEDLNHVVQSTIDRIIFLRICEDRGIERHGQLLEVADQPDTYGRLAQLFVQADHRYNSGLFHFQKEQGREASPDKISLNTAIADKPLQLILRSLYFPYSQFEFSVLPADILGHIYEQFLGETVEVSPRRRVTIELKPEVRKVGGVYYTATDIVRRIVQETMTAELSEEKSIETLRRKRKSRPVSVLDPACGSGSFLIEAYQELLHWHLAEYIADAEKWSRGRSPKIIEIGAGGYRLSADERKRILLDHIFGVDVDPQAVEVTKLSLLLKVLEGETDETVDAQLRLFHARALPDLDTNVRCGNSLLGGDFYGLAGAKDLPAEVLVRLNPFDWASEFPDVMAQGGFTCVIGNPPYVLMQNAGLPLQESYLSINYKSARYKIDTYIMFMERGVQLLRSGGRLGFITPTSFLLNRHAMTLRELLLDSCRADLLRINLYPAFPGASVDTTVSVWTKDDSGQGRCRIELAHRPSTRLELNPVRQKTWQTTPRKSFLALLDDDAVELVNTMHDGSVLLGSFATAYFGIQTYDRTRHVRTSPLGNRWKPALDGANINPFVVAHPTEYVDTAPNAIKSGGDSRVYERERIGVRQIGSRPIAALLPAGWYSLNTIYNIYPVVETEYDLRFVLALLNSAAMGEFWRVMNYDYKPTFPKIKKDALLGVPVPEIDFGTPSSRRGHDAICDLVDRRMSVASALSTAKRPAERERLTRQAKALTAELETAVRIVYGLGP